jgi:acetyl-CoA acyltransferase
MTQNTPGSLQDVYVLAAVRTPIGRIGGALAAVRPDDLAATAVRNVVERLPGLDPAAIDEAYLGDANGAGEDNRNVARMAVLLAGLPVTIPGATVNRLCGSGLEAVMDGSRAVAVGDADVVLAGGVESMSRAPWVLPKPAKGYPTGHEQLWSTTLGWRMTNPLMPSEWTISLGEGAEVLADKYSISREAQDAFALASHQNAAAAWEAGWFADETVAVPGAPLERDECIRADSTLEKLAALKPVFRAGGTVTAGNASPMNDGAAGLVLASEAGAQRAGASPLARVVSRATSGVEPHLYGIGPVEAARRALARAGLVWGDLAAVELNEAFAAQSLACLAEWPELDPAIVNPQGGAIAIGHPLGCSGARILTTLIHHLRRTGGRYGLAAMCIGVGQGIAVVVENTESNRA